MTCDAPLPTGVSRERLAGLLEPLFRRHARLAVAVSGGSDSMALVHLLKAAGGAGCAAVAGMTVITVDHRLRPGSAAEARQVGDWIRGLGLDHEVLTWAGLKPASGIQAAARAARYRLLVDYCLAHGLTGLVTAHTRDDQAETVLMRLARGSGIDGLAGMRAERPLGLGITLHRPLLDIPKAALRDYLAAKGASWIDDPSNDNPVFERVRWRQACGTLEALGLTAAAVATTARRAASVRDAVNWAVEHAVAAAGAGEFRLDPLGYAVIDLGWFATMPDEIRLRLIGGLIWSIGGHPERVALAALEAAVGRMTATSDAAMHTTYLLAAGLTLHGAQVSIIRDRLYAFREPHGRRKGETVPAEIAALSIAPGEAATVWDNRFAITLTAAAPARVTVGPLGAAGLARLDGEGVRRPDGVPARVLWTLPALTGGDGAMAVPHLGVWRDSVPCTAVEIRLARQLVGRSWSLG